MTEQLTKKGIDYKALIAATLILTLAFYPQIIITLIIIVGAILVVKMLSSKTQLNSTNKEESGCSNCSHECSHHKDESTLSKIDKWLAERPEEK